MAQPLILTLQLDETAQAFYESLRQRHFPPERNHIPAHLTLFHQLPDEAQMHHTLHDVASATPTFRLTKPTARSIGRGVAVFVHADALTALHAVLSSAFQAHLTRQDSQRFQPHIVIQNKVQPETAKHTLAELHDLPLIEPSAIGLTLWRYLGGPWEHLRVFPFANSASQ